MIDRELVTDTFRTANKHVATCRGALRACYDANGPQDTESRKELRRALAEWTQTRTLALRKLFADGAVITHLQLEQSEVDEDPRTAIPNA